MHLNELLLLFVSTPSCARDAADTARQRAPLMWQCSGSANCRHALAWRPGVAAVSGGAPFPCGQGAVTRRSRRSRRMRRTDTWCRPPGPQACPDHRGIRVSPARADPDHAAPTPCAGPGFWVNASGGGAGAECFQMLVAAHDEDQARDSDVTIIDASILLINSA